MRKLLLILAIAASARAAECNLAMGSNNPKTLSTSAASWSCGRIPTSGDSARWSGTGTSALTIDIDWTVGEGVSSFTGSGTITIATSSGTISGTGTAFLTELQVGDVISYGVKLVLVTAVTNDTTATYSYQFSTATTNSAYTIRRHAIWATAPYTLAAGKTLTVRGNWHHGGTTFSAGAGATMILATSASGGTLYLHLNTGDQSSSENFTSSGTSGARNTLTTDGGAYAAITENSTSGATFLYTDISHFGNASTRGMGITPNASGQTLKFDHCTFADVGQIVSGTNFQIGLAANVVFTFNQILSVPSGATAPHFQLQLNGAAGAPTGQRIFTDNVWTLPNFNIETVFTPHVGWTIARNIVSRIRANSAVGRTVGSFTDNLVVMRPYPGTTTNVWASFGDGGDTFNWTYVLQDEGPAQMYERSFAANDNPVQGGNWTIANSVYDTVGPFAGSGTCQLRGCDYHHGPAAPSDSGTLVTVTDRIIVPPASTGFAGGYLYNRALTSKITNAVTHSTFASNVKVAGNAGEGYSAIYSAGGSAGVTNVIATVKNNLSWARAAYGGSAYTNTLALVATDGSTVRPDLLNSANIANNAHYNAMVGTLYDSAGANGTSALGFHNWKQTTKPTLATDINLGNGTDERTQGPRFADTSRNFALFDSAYLGNAATAWQDAHAYSVGDIVSASDSGFYGGATINYRCVTAHTSASADTTNGKPGAATNYRTNWEFATAYRIRTAIIAGTTYTDGSIGAVAASPVATLIRWMQTGYTPSNPAIWCAGDDGDTIGAVSFCAQGKRLTAFLGGQ